VKVLVSAASKHGSTEEIAGRIARSLRDHLLGDHIVDVRPAAEVDALAAYDAVILGSAVYMGRWLEDARWAAARIAAQPPRPVWLFSSGPVGDPLRPDEAPVELGDIAITTRAREHVVFGGRLDRRQLGFAERAVVTALHVPDGDYRDWAAIATWGSRIADELNAFDRATYAAHR
jgi:menaquinone-dependent protoporphyrinogen oxidase